MPPRCRSRSRSRATAATAGAAAGRATRSAATSDRPDRPPRRRPRIDEPDEGSLGVPIYPGAQFLTSYDAGRGQRYYLFGTNAAFAEIVQYYRNVAEAAG